MPARRDREVRGGSCIFSPQNSCTVTGLALHSTHKDSPAQGHSESTLNSALIPKLEPVTTTALGFVARQSLTSNPTSATQPPGPGPVNFTHTTLLSPASTKQLPWADPGLATGYARPQRAGPAFDEVRLSGRQGQTVLDDTAHVPREPAVWGTAGSTPGGSWGAWEILEAFKASS